MLFINLILTRYIIKLAEGERKWVIAFSDHLYPKTVKFAVGFTTVSTALLRVIPFYENAIKINILGLVIC